MQVDQFSSICTLSLGCKIKALRAKTNTYIKTPVRGEAPVFSISGRPDHVNTAKWEILAAADHFSQIRASRSTNVPATGSASDKVTIYVRVPYRVVGLVVGPRGATVKRIQQITRTFIVTPSRDKEPCFEVRGTPENVERARKEIESYIVLRTGNKCDLDEDPELGGQSIDELTQQMQQCQVMDYPAFQYPVPMDAPSTAKKTTRKVSGGGLEIPVSKAPGEVDTNAQWSTDHTMPTVFSGMRFTPPDVSYQPMSAPLLTAEMVFDYGTGKQQPLSPTGSYESNSSDGLAATSPKQSPLLPQQGQGLSMRYCCMCRSSEEMAALLPCGHNMFCQTCAHYISCSTGSCPLCNAQVTNVMHR